MNNQSEARLKEVHPELSKRVHQMADMLATEGIEIEVTQGLRSWNQQWALWQDGRDADGNIVDPKRVVTMAKAGHSWHNFGLAVDVVPDDPARSAFQPDWNANHPVWKRVVAVGESCGLVSGSTWRTFPDWPHFQLTGNLPVSPNDEVRQTFLDGGMDAVWNDTGIAA